MAFNNDKPIHFQETAESDWQVLSRLDEYSGTISREGFEKERFIAIAHRRYRGRDTIFAQVSDGAIGVFIDWHWEDSADVQEMVNGNLPLCSDFIGYLDSLGYPADHAVTQAALTHLQTMINDARDAA